MMATKNLLPKETNALIGNNLDCCENPYLYFYRYNAVDETKGSVEITPETKNKKFKKAAKKNNTPDLAFYKDRQEALLKNLKQQGYHFKTFELKTNTRLIVGLGNEGVLEVGISLHPLFGFPYIPSTAVKGLCRAWLEIGEDEFGGRSIEDEDELSQAIKTESLRVFGSEDKDEKNNEVDFQMGKVLFFDAFPVGQYKLEEDVMTPHYQPYYQNPEKNAPGDWYAPNPIKFLTVAANTLFHFALASKDTEALKHGRDWLRNGLSNLGLGAKTHSGYGYFEEKTQEERTYAEKIKHIELLKIKKEELEKQIGNSDSELQLSDYEKAKKVIETEKSRKWTSQLIDFCHNLSKVQRAEIYNYAYQKDTRFIKGRLKKNKKFWIDLKNDAEEAPNS